jgi:uncharacterized membrane protein
LRDGRLAISTNGDFRHGTISESPTSRLERQTSRNTKRIAVTAFALLTGGIIRACHHWAHIPWELDALLASNTVQTSRSIVWGLLAISCMLYGNRRRNRAVWITGSILVAIVVGKLFLVELSASGTLQRIVSFISVGLLLLIVGYFAPLPPRKSKDE